MSRNFFRHYRLKLWVIAFFNLYRRDEGAICEPFTVHSSVLKSERNIFPLIQGRQLLGANYIPNFSHILIMRLWKRGSWE